MEMKEYFSGLSPEQKKQFAKDVETSVAYLSQISNGHRLAGMKIAVRIEKETNQIVTMVDLRPDIFAAA